jgi:hypothetical protein
MLAQVMSGAAGCRSRWLELQSGANPFERLLESKPGKSAPAVDHDQHFDFHQFAVVAD